MTSTLVQPFGLTVTGSYCRWALRLQDNAGKLPSPCFGKARPAFPLTCRKVPGLMLSADCGGLCCPEPGVQTTEQRDWYEVDRIGS